MTNHSDQTTGNPAPRILARVPRGPDQEVRIQQEPSALVSVRTWTRSPSGQWQPKSGDGILIRPDEVRRLVFGLKSADPGPTPTPTAAPNGRPRPGTCRGTRCHMHKLDDEKVAEIRNRYSNGGVSQRQLAAEYDVSQPVISGIINGFSWKHVGRTESIRS